MMYMMNPGRRMYPEMVADRMMREMLGIGRRGMRPGFRVDVKEMEQGYQLTAELPGVPMEAVEVTVDADTLTIAAECTAHKDEDRKDYLIMERRGGRMERSFTLEGIRQEAITASMADGLLTVWLPREQPPEGGGPRRIAIGAPALPADAAEQ